VHGQPAHQTEQTHVHAEPERQVGHVQNVDVVQQQLVRQEVVQTGDHALEYCDPNQLPLRYTVHCIVKQELHKIHFGLLRVKRLAAVHYFQSFTFI